MVHHAHWTKPFDLKQLIFQSRKVGQVNREGVDLDLTSCLFRRFFDFGLFGLEALCIAAAKYDAIETLLSESFRY